MKLAIVYNPDERKLKPYSYSYIYRGMFDALVEAFEDVMYITENCDADDIEADVIFFFDPQSSHHITIWGIYNHPAVKMEYMSDPHQIEFKGYYQQDKSPVHKLGPVGRMMRAKERNVTHIVSPVYNGFYRFLGKYLEDINLIHFPFAPSFERKRIPFSERVQLILANGATWAGSLRCYEFRNWAFQQPYVHHVSHYIQERSTPHGQRYMDLLYRYCGGLALSEFYPVPKYFEMAAAGMVVFAQHHKEFEDLGFTDYDTCIYVNKDNFEERCKAFLDNPYDYEQIGINAQKLMESYTANKFGEFIYGKTKDTVH